MNLREIKKRKTNDRGGGGEGEHKVLTANQKK